MSNIVLLLGVAIVSWCVVSFVRRHRRGIVAERGMSIGADLAALRDQPRVQVRSMTTAGPGRVRLILASETDAGDDLDLVVLLGEDEFGFQLLQDWERSGNSIAVVMPPDSRIVRLRSIDDLQPLTLRREDEE